jgi:integrase
MRSNSLDIEQTQKLRDALRGHELEALIMLALVTGLRRDELLSLKWQDVDLDAHKLTVQNSKTKSSARMIPIPEDVALLLKEHQMHQTEAQEKAGLTWANLDLVFPDSHGEPLDPHQLMQGFHEVTDLARLPRISFHDLRVTVGQTLHKQQERRA